MTMILIIPDIPITTTKKHLELFLKPALHSIWSFNRGKILKIHIIEVEYTNQTAYHGLIYVSTTKLGNKIIKKLNNSLLCNESVVVKEYVNRSWHNDPRKTNLLIKNNFRKRDRRRGRKQLMF